MVAATRKRKKKRGEGEGEEDRGLWEGEQQWRWLGKTVVIAPGGMSARLKRYWAGWWERGWKGENLIIPLLTTVFIKQCWKVKRRFLKNPCRDFALFYKNIITFISTMIFYKLMLLRCYRKLFFSSSYVVIHHMRLIILCKNKNDQSQLLDQNKRSRLKYFKFKLRFYLTVKSLKDLLNRKSNILMI